MSTNNFKELNVLIDCEKLKYPNTGLYVYCKSLINAIESIKFAHSLEPTYMLPSNYKQEGISSIKNSLLGKIFFPFKTNFDVFHVPFQLGRVLKTSKKVVLTVHDLNFLYEKNGKRKKKHLKRLQRNIDRSDYIVAISEFVKADILKYCDIKDKPIKVIYNGCSFYNGKQVANPLKYQPKGEFLFTLGTVLTKKNFHVLPCLLRDNDLELIIAGNESSYNKTILDEAKKFNVQDRVKIIGPISEEDKDWYYRNCKAFVFPSIAEGFGLPVVEALSYGKPTFISKHTCLPEIGGDYCYYFNFDFNREEMINEFNQGLQDSEKRNFAETIEYAKTFTWERTATEYAKVYKAVTND